MCGSIRSILHFSTSNNDTVVEVCCSAIISDDSICAMDTEKSDDGEAIYCLHLF